MFTPTQLLLIAIVSIPLLLVIFAHLRMDLAALIIAVCLGLAQYFGFGMLGSPDNPAAIAKSISGFGQDVVVTLMSLFILTRGLERSGVTRWLARRIVGAGGSSESKLIGLFAAVTAFLSLFMNNLAAGALVLPSALEAARRTRIRPSKLLIPVAYGSLLGGAATYFTTANIIVSGLLPIASPPQAPLNILDFTPTGGLIALAGIAFLYLFGRRWLPERDPAPEQMITRLTGTELEDLYHIGERLWEARVLPDSPLVGKTLYETRIGENLGIEVVAIWQGHNAIITPPPNQIIQGGDILLIVGREERVVQLQPQQVVIGRETPNNHISPYGVTMLEIILAPHTQSEGRSLKELDFRRRYGFTAVALRRVGRSYRTNVGDFKLAMGDAILVIGPYRRLRDLEKAPDFIVIQPSLSDQPLDRRQTLLTASVVLGAIAASIAGVPVYLSVLTGALVIILAKVLTMEEAYRSIEWQAIFLIAGLYTVSLAMIQTGLADLLGNAMLRLVTPFGPLGLAAGSYLMTAILTQFMGGQVTALVTGPVAIHAAVGMSVSPQAIAVATAIGCSTSFFTPLAHPVNILMMSPANYAFEDFFKIGWRLTLVCFVMLLVGMVLFWGL
jgi:di/tricarboxylate transporter